jgi:phenylacetate-CoA ligase
MPLLRYRIGDDAVTLFGECSCGSLLPAVQRILGRTDDNVVTRDGRLVGRLDHVFKGLVGLRESQIIQEDPDTFRVKTVHDALFDEHQKAVLENRLKERIGMHITVCIEPVEEIPRTARGKFKGVVSLVNNSVQVL